MPRKILSLAAALLLAFCASASADWYSGLIPAVKTQPSDFTGKTVIIHTNDVHGAVEGYARVPALKSMLLERSASDVLTVDAGDFMQGSIYVNISKGRTAVELMNKAGYDLAITNSTTAALR